MGDSSARHRRRRRGQPTYRLVRYADDFVVVVHSTKAHVEALRDEAATVVAPMGQRRDGVGQAAVAVADDKLDTVQAKVAQIAQEVGPEALGFAVPTAQPRTSRRPSALTPVAITTACETTGALRRTSQKAASKKTYGNGCSSSGRPRQVATSVSS